MKKRLNEPYKFNYAKAMKPFAEWASVSSLFISFTELMTSISKNELNSYRIEILVQIVNIRHKTLFNDY